MKKFIIVGLCALSYVIPWGAYAASAEPVQSWPVSFETLSYHVNAIFPVPSREAKQANSANHFYMAQAQSEPNSLGHRLKETFSLVYQETSAIATSGDSLKAKDVADQFVASLKAHKEVQFKEIPVTHAYKDSTLNQQYRILEVTESGRTDYYLMRVVMTSEGIVVAIQTIQKDEKAPLDWQSADLWAFIDSVKFVKEG